MANDITSWSTTAASNTTLDGLTWAEGQSAASLNNSARQMMASTKAWYNDMTGAKVTGGTANALTLTSDVGFTSLANGRAITARVGTANSGSATLNVNGLGAKQIRLLNGTADVALSGGEMLGVHTFVYLEAANSAAGGWVLMNPIITLSTLVSATDLPWLSKPIGEPFPLMTDLSATPPANNSSLYRFVELTHGLTGSGQYNEGVLTSASTSGSAPLVLATAVVSLSGSPLNGQTIRMINTEERFLRAAASPGTVQADAFQGHYHDPLSPLTTYVGGRTSGTIIGSGINFGNVNTTGAPTTDGTNGTPRTANETRPKNIGVKYFLRIK